MDNKISDTQPSVANILNTNGIGNIDESIWFHNPKTLIESFQLIPNKDDSLNKKLNTIMRLCLLVASILLFYDSCMSITLILISIILIGIIYSKKSPSIVENFKNNSDLVKPNSVNLFMREFSPNISHRATDATNATNATDPYMAEYGVRGITKDKNSKIFCHEQFLPDGFDSLYISQNQLLAGGPNPKTFIPPYIAPPSHDTKSWKVNDLVIQSGINSRTNFDTYRSGYGEYASTNSSETKYNYRGATDAARKHSVNDTNVDNDVLIPGDQTAKARDRLLTQTIQPGVFQKSLISEPIQSNIGISYTPHFYPTVVTSTDDFVKFTSFPETAQNRQREPTNETSEPINYKQNKRVATDQLTEVEVLPERPETAEARRASLSAREAQLSVSQTQNLYNIYDPRLSGYSSNSRYYLDSLNGQPKFFYDDIDSVTRPNYITRNNIDIFPWAPTYGDARIGTSNANIAHKDERSEHLLTYQNRIKDGINTNVFTQLNTAREDAARGGTNLQNFKTIANNTFTDATLLFRTDLQERLMRKRNAELWQRRVAPISTQGRMSCALNSCL